MVKRFPVVNALAVILGMFVLGMAGTADALTYGTLPTTFNPPGSSGLSSDNFTYDQSGGVEVGLKAHQRYLGDVTRVGNVYSVPTGYSTVSGTPGTTDPPNAAWNFDFSVNLGTGTFSNYDMLLKYDVDPGTGTSWKTWATSAGVVTINGVTYPDTVTGSLWQDSQNYGFGFLGVPSFDATKNADYNFILSVYDHSTGGLVASTDMLVKVGTGAPVPIPGAVWLLGSGIVGLIGLKRRNNKRDKPVS